MQVWQMAFGAGTKHKESDNMFDRNTSRGRHENKRQIYLLTCIILHNDNLSTTFLKTSSLVRAILILSLLS